MFEFRRLSRAKLQIFSTLSFTFICLVIVFADSFISNLSLQSLVLDTKYDVQNLTTHDLVKSAPNHQPEKLSIKEETREIYHDDHDHHHHGDFVPPFNITEQERINWFKKKLPEFEIFKSNHLTREFNNRVNIFFNEDVCKVRFFMTWISPASSFGDREFLAMESLFKSHPQGCLMILSRSMDSGRGSRILNPLLENGFRVIAISPDLSFLFENTPAEYWLDELKSGNKDPGEIPLAQNLSNLIRLAVLYKYGGVYLDTDFIILKDFSGLRNSIGAQSVNVLGNWTRLNNAVLVFDKKHPLLYRFIEEFASTFDGNKWGHNGPYLVSRVVQRVATESGQFNFTILPPMAFYPVDWTKISGLFTHPVDRVHSKWVEAKLLQLSGATYGVHLWNKQSSRLRIEEGSIISRLVAGHCVICKQVHSS